MKRHNVDSLVLLYVVTKKANELMAYACFKLYSIPATGLLFFGPMGRPDMAYFKFADTLRVGGMIKIFNMGDRQRGFTYVDDIVEGLVLVMANPPAVEIGADCPPKAAHRAYNIGNSNPESLLNFVDTLQRVLVEGGVLPKDYDFEAHREFAPIQPGDVPVTYADTSALERDTDVRPSIPLEDGLREFARWYRSSYGL